MSLKHFQGCTADYPEKPAREAPQQILETEFDGYLINTCADCGATDSNLPPEDDPYWDDVR